MKYIFQSYENIFVWTQALQEMSSQGWKVHSWQVHGSLGIGTEVYYVLFYKET